MTSSTLLYIAWPLTLGLSYMAGSMILSKDSTPKQSEVSHRYSSNNSSTNKNSAVTNHRTSSARSHRGKSGNAESHDIKEIININDNQKRLSELLSMIDQLSPDDFEQIIADFRGEFLSVEGRFSERRVEYKILLEAWAKINPQGALADAKENAKSTFASKTILSTWAGYAPDAAIQWVKLNHVGNKANSYLLDIIKGSASNNLEDAIDIFQELPLSHDTDYVLALEAIQHQVSKLGSEKAIAWLATIKSVRLRAEATRSIAYRLAEEDPQGTIDWLKSLPAKTLNYNASMIASVLVKQDINQAVEWTNSLKGRARTSAAEIVIEKLVSLDPNKTANWIKTMSGNHGYTSLVNSFMDSVQDEHPELALANLEQIKLGWDRDDRLKNILTSWATKDKGAATHWMQSNNVDAETQKQVLFNLANDRRW